MTKQKRVLVTGCAGFIGSNLVDHLISNGYFVLGMDSFTTYYDPEIKKKNLENAMKSGNRYEKFVLLDYDISTRDFFPDVDYVFHLAAQPGVRESWGPYFDRYVRDNITATQRLLEYYKNKPPEKFVYSSSSSVYGNAASFMRLGVTEDIRTRPISPYGVTKLAAENLVYLYHINYGLPTISLRYFTVYGPRNRPDMAVCMFVNDILNECPITVYGDGEQKRDFTYIDDVVAANMLAATSDRSGEVYNIGGGNSITVNALIKLIEKATGKTAAVYYQEKQKGDVQDTLAYNGKAKTELGWVPTVKIEDGIKRYVEWYS